MGFDAGLYVYPKRNGSTMEDVYDIDALLSYERNTWAQSNFATAEEYAKYIRPSFKPQPEDAVDFYRQRLHDTDYGIKALDKEYGIWCSNGLNLYHWIQDSGMGEPINNSESIILNKADVVQIMQHCWDELKRGLPVECGITKAYRYERDDEGNIPENADITLLSVDGFEVEYMNEDDDDYNHYIKRIDTLPDWECNTIFPIHDVDTWQYGGYEEGLEACMKLLAETDFSNSWIVYSAGW